MGRSSLRTKKKEETLVLRIVSTAEACFHVSPRDLLGSVQKLLKNLGRKNDFTGQNLTLARASVTLQELQKWFVEVFEYLEEEGLDRILREPNSMINADETTFFLKPKGNKVFADKCCIKVYQQINSSVEECTFVLINASADGRLVPL
ncbi:hypothetical protein PR048_008782 [Dryococelus australis]|uniref:Uncharacterized protein n=1 Tax=Dryococelus australis TaxID=614101 RepID=A0ABQ9HYY3_9NEOP|nr:hypothetical protein PR048_008782 [Dryococelus australis]